MSGRRRAGDSPLLAVRLALHRAGRAAGHAARRYYPLGLLLIAATAAMWAGYVLARRIPLPPPPNRVEVQTLNVGQGEASWLRTADGRFVVIGGGPEGQGDKLVASLRAAGARRIDLLALPYAYLEAIGGASAVVRAFPVSLVIEPGGPEINRQQGELRALLRAKGVPVRVVRAGQSFSVGGATVETLAPAEPLSNVPPAAANNSLVLRVVWGTTAFLWAGGIERAGEGALLSRAPDLSARWLRAARFGTSEASSPEFLRLVNPALVVVSVGPNAKGYPSREALERLRATGTRVYRTDARPEPLRFYSDGAQITGPF